MASPSASEPSAATSLKKEMDVSDMKLSPSATVHGVFIGVNQDRNTQYI